MRNETNETPSILRIPHLIRFWYFLSANTFSLICTVFTLYFLLFDSNLRRALHNHIILVLLVLGLIYELTVIPWFIRNDQTDRPWSASIDFYRFWVFFDYSFYSLQIALFAWATMERHILIFHDLWITTKIRRFFIHYCPIIGIIVYYLIYYSIVYFVIPCQTPFDGFLAGGIYIPCAFDRTVLATWDLMFHQVVPTLIIMSFCLALIIRVTWQKIRVRQPIQWRKHRKMIVQLLTISIVYIVFNLPWVIVIFAYQCGLSIEIAIYGIIYGKFLLYNIIFYFPLFCIVSLPELRAQVMKKLFCQRWFNHRIGQMTTATAVRTQVAETNEQTNVQQ